jgi:hypothetical protein
MSFYANEGAEGSYQRDLALLENLKETIRNGQHPYYRPVPQPERLSSLYLGPHRSTFVLPHPEQIPGYDHASQAQPLGSSFRPVVVDSDSSRPSSMERQQQQQPSSSRPAPAVTGTDQVCPPDLLPFPVLY